MTRKTEFHCVEFFRGVRDNHAALLKGRSHAEIAAFFSALAKQPQEPAARSARSRKTARRSRA